MCVEVPVMLFGKQVMAIRDENGAVMFERKSFINALSVPRAKRIFGEMQELLSFLGDDGADEIIAAGKEHILCNLILADKRASEELREYATAWVTAYEMLAAE